MRAWEMMQARGNYVPFGRCGLGDIMRAWGDGAGLGLRGRLGYVWGREHDAGLGEYVGLGR